MPSEFVRQGVEFATREDRYGRSSERAAWEKEQARINACCNLPTEEIEGIAKFDLWHLL